MGRMSETHCAAPVADVAGARSTTLLASLVHVGGSDLHLTVGRAADASGCNGALRAAAGLRRR